MKVFTKEELAKARWNMRFMGLGFIAVGVWLKSENLQCTRSFSKALVAMLGGDNCAVVYAWFCFGMGALLISGSFLKPYQEWRSNQRT
jgi:hypothetical protein